MTPMFLISYMKKIKLKTKAVYLFNQLLQYISPLRILSTEKSIDLIINNEYSIARYGDGELNIIMGGGIHFQDFNESLRRKLIYILQCKNENYFKVGIPIAINTTSGYNKEAATFWKKNMSTGRFHWFRLCNIKKEYINASFTWCLSDYQNKKEAAEQFKKIIKIWENKDIFIVEGEKSKLGVNNTLFSNTKSIKRIICPDINAYNYYDEIKHNIIKNLRNELVLISLGPTATVLAYELYKKGIRSIDIGHLNFHFNNYIKYFESNRKLSELSYDDYKKSIIIHIKSIQ